MTARSLIQSADITLEGALDIPCELRLQHKATGRFITVYGGGGDVVKFVDRWQDASYYGSTTDNDEDNTFDFLWNWLVECDETWMKDEDKNDYRLHVVIGSFDSE